MNSLTFKQELLLMVIDKAVIALLVLGFVYFGQKKLKGIGDRHLGILTGLAAFRTAIR